MSKCQYRLFDNLAQYAGIEINRWEKGIDHDPRSEAIARAIGEIDFDVLGDCLKFGGDGDNGEQLMYALDVYFEQLDKGVR